MKNTDLFKLLKFQDNDPLSDSKTLNEEEIENMIIEYDSKGVLNPDCRIFFEPFLDNAITEQIAMLRIFPTQFNPKNIYQSDLYIEVDIIVHQAISKIKGGRRRNRILSEVIKSLNGAKINLVQPLWVVDKPVTLRQFNQDFWGWSLLMQSGVAANG